jgi:hypothetical protein
MAAAGDLKPPFTLLQIATVFRQRVDDLPGDVVDEDATWPTDDSALLWKNDEIAGYLDEACHEFAIRVPIKDDQTAAVCQIAVLAGTASYDYDTRIQSIERIKFVETASGDEKVLSKSTHQIMDQDEGEWSDADREPGMPKFYLENMDAKRLTLSPSPEFAGTLYLAVRRFPLSRLVWGKNDHSTIEIPTEHHYNLLDWMLHKAYMKRDAETENPELSKEHKALFDEAVGERPSANLLRVRRKERNLRRRVRANWF